MYQNASKVSYEKRKAVFDQLRREPCTDCKQKYEPCQMQFDHIGDDKTGHVSRIMKNRGMKEMLAEIAKCELVCANCHALRTYNRIERNP
jgi:hypothetical protein